MHYFPLEDAPADSEPELLITKESTKREAERMTYWPLEDAEPDGGHSLLLPFDTDSAVFRRGVEIGMLYARLDHEDGFSATIHADNAEMIMRVMEARGVSFTASPLGEDWLAVTVGGERL